MKKIKVTLMGLLVSLGPFSYSAEEVLVPRREDDPVTTQELDRKLGTLIGTAVPGEEKLTEAFDIIDHPKFDPNYVHAAFAPLHKVLSTMTIGGDMWGKSDYLTKIGRKLLQHPSIDLAKKAAGMTPLEWAIRVGATDLAQDIREKLKKEVEEALLESTPLPREIAKVISEFAYGGRSPLEEASTDNAD